MQNEKPSKDGNPLADPRTVQEWSNSTQANKPQGTGQVFQQLLTTEEFSQSIELPVVTNSTAAGGTSKINVFERNVTESGVSVAAIHNMDIIPISVAIGQP